jgi:para-aminobenzoate synthetase / 4-amino-4-deoxychorismate lyase
VATASRPDPGQGVFETLLVLDGRPIEIEAHMARLRASLSSLFPALEPPPIEEPVLARARAIERGGLRVTVRPQARAGLEATIEPAPVAPQDVLPAAPALVEARSVTLAGGLGPHKWADRRLLDAMAASRAAVPLILDADGSLLEASRGNAFAVIGDRLLTPPADGRILPGITRARMIAVAAAAGIEVEERALHRDRLDRADEIDEIFLTGSVRGVERVRALDGVPLGIASRVSVRLASGLRRAWLDGLDRVPRR